MPSYDLGVDLGTTFVGAAVCAGRAPEMFTLGERSVVSPSVVFAGADGALVTGEAAARRLLSDPERVAQEFKRRIGDPTPTMLGGTAFSPVRLMAELLRGVLAKVTATEGRPPRSVVLTHPANWGPYRRGLFEEVPGQAGLGEHVVLVTEPEAAAAHYAATRELADGQMVAVYDLGGGTFDVTVLRRDGDTVRIVGKPEGIERLGGIDFDEAILKHVDHVSGGVLGDLDPRDPRNVLALARLRQDCVLAKESLSTDDETVVPVFLPGNHLDVRITRGQFEDLVRGHVESTVSALDRALRSAHVSPDELDAVLLVGGSSRIPLVARMVSEQLGHPTLVDTHPKYAVALGAATIAARRGPEPSRRHDAPPRQDPAPAAGSGPAASYPPPLDPSGRRPPDRYRSDPPGGWGPPEPAAPRPPQPGPWGPPDHTPSPAGPYAAGPHAAGPRAGKPTPRKRRLAVVAVGVLLLAAAAGVAIAVGGGGTGTPAGSTAATDTDTDQPTGSAEETTGQATEPATDPTAPGAAPSGGDGAPVSLRPYAGERVCELITPDQVGALSLEPGQAYPDAGTCEWRGGAGYSTLEVRSDDTWAPSPTAGWQGYEGVADLSFHSYPATRYQMSSSSGDNSCNVVAGGGAITGSFHVIVTGKADHAPLCDQATAMADAILGNLR